MPAIVVAENPTRAFRSSFPLVAGPCLPRLTVFTAIRPGVTLCKGLSKIWLGAVVAGHRRDWEALAPASCTSWSVVCSVLMALGLPFCEDSSAVELKKETMEG